LTAITIRNIIQMRQEIAYELRSFVSHDATTDALGDLRAGVAWR